ncbi:MAG: CotH kinase family protein [Clostridia bacterium]|nr:CotH kinase family protein [Clostridia bacterium]
MNKRKILQRVLAVIAGVLGGILWYDHRHAPVDIADLRAVIENETLVVSWRSPAIVRTDHLELTIVKDEESATVRLMPWEDTYTATDISSSDLVRVSLQAFFRDGSAGAMQATTARSVAPEDLPNLMTLKIVTDTGNDPTYRVREKSDPTWPGETITDAAYLTARVDIIENGAITSDNLPLSIRVRGNTSAVGNPKKPYKLQFPAGIDLLGLGPDYAETDWLLINCGSDLKTLVGNYIGLLCGQEWVPQMRFVNVMLNGDWKGLYVLSEPVNLLSSHGAVSEDGLIIESDPYWWASDGLYFSVTQSKNYHYTFKYPRLFGVKDPRIGQVQQAIQQIEDLAEAGQEDVFERLDIDSFVAWMMDKDLMGVLDAAGSNRYMYMESFDAQGGQSTQLKAGPLWDFDSSFQSVDQFCPQHSDWSIYKSLFEMASFNTRYRERFDEVKGTLSADVEAMLQPLLADQGEALNESRRLNNERWDATSSDVFAEADQIVEWLDARIAWMDTALAAAE